MISIVTDSYFVGKVILLLYNDAVVQIFYDAILTDYPEAKADINEHNYN